MTLKLAPMWFFSGVFVIAMSSGGALLIEAELQQVIEAPAFNTNDVEVYTTDVGVNTTVTVIPVHVELSREPLSEFVSASRVRIPGWSRLQHMDKFHYIFRVKIEVPSYRSLGTNSKVSVCFDQNHLLDLGECEKESWRPLDKGGSWMSSMSPFQDKFVDIRVTNSLSGPPVNISVWDERSTFRLIFLGLGVILLVMAPIVSGWVPFYYGSAMTLGILMVVLVILYQAMRVLPTGRKSSLYILLYGSLAGLGTVAIRYFSALVSTILLEMGFSDDMYSPVAIFVGVGVALIGAWLGYLGVRKLVIAEDGNIDEGIAEFVKWAIRIVGSFSLIQSSSDYVFMILALIGGLVISWVLLNVRVSLLDVWENLQDLWRSEPVIPKGVSTKEMRKPHLTQAQIDALRRLPGSETLMISKHGLVNYPMESSTPSMRRKRASNTNNVFPSTFHQSPGYKPSSKQEYVEISQEVTNNAMDELLKSNEYAEWRQLNKHRVVVEPYEHRQERAVEEIELTASLEEAAPSQGVFSYKRK